jgi:hypothetical protein
LLHTRLGINREGSGEWKNNSAFFFLLFDKGNPYQFNYIQLQQIRACICKQSETLLFLQRLGQLAFFILPHALLN